MARFFEMLEARELLSVSPVVKAPPETIAADQLAITTAIAQLATDKVAWAATLKTDRAAIPSVNATNKANIKASEQAVKDARGNPTELEAAKGNLLVTKANAKSALADAKAKIKSDQGIGKITLADDKKAITQAKLKLREDRIAK